MGVCVKPFVLHPRAGCIWAGDRGGVCAPVQGWRGELRAQTPALLLPQLSYNMVSACNRLCRMRLLCSPRTEGEELVRCWGCIMDTEGLCPHWGGPVVLSLPFSPSVPFCAPSAAVRATRRRKAAAP